MTNADKPAIKPGIRSPGQEAEQTGGEGQLAGVLIESIEVVEIRPARLADAERVAPPRDQGSGSAAWNSAILVLGAGAVGYVLARLLRSSAAEAPPVTRRLSATRNAPDDYPRASGDSPKRHGDKFGRTMRSFRSSDNAPTYPEG